MADDNKLVDAIVNAGSTFLLAVGGGIGVLVAASIIEFGARLVLSFV